MLSRVFALLVVFLVFLYIFMPSLGPGAKDGMLEIAEGVYFSHSGGYQNNILVEKDGEKLIVVSAQVEDFYVFQGTVYVARRPVVYERNNNRVESKVLLMCEYWTIELVSGVVGGPFEYIDGADFVKNCGFKK